MKIKLKSIYTIPKEESLLIFKADIKVIDYLTTYVEYEVYHPLTLVPLNLTYCENIKININIPVKMDNTIEIYYDSLSEYGYNLFDKNNSFYQDICTKYTSPNGTDILLLDRKKDIYNKSNSEYFCQKGCKLQSYNSTAQKALCNCECEQIIQIQESLNDYNFKDIINLFDTEEMQDKFYKTISNSNFHVLKCFK